jgi:hypothetical protein
MDESGTLLQIPIHARADVVVAGGTAGAAALALAPKRRGHSVFLACSRPYLGTDLCGGMRLWPGEMEAPVPALARAVFPDRTKPSTPMHVKLTLEQALVEAEVPFLLNAHFAGIVDGDGDWPQCAWFVTQSGLLAVETGQVIDKRQPVRLAGKQTVLHTTLCHGAGCFVDATGCADIPAAAGAPVRTISAEHVAVQGTGLAGLAPGRDYHNSDHSFSDDTDVADTTAFLVSSKLKFRDHFDAGQLVDSRERRQIVGEIELGPADFLAERRYPDTICVSSSNFDSHGFTIHPVFMCKPPDKKRMWADVPFRALLPRGVERVLATGLGMSAHRDALPVVRMQPDVQNHGYAAGYAAALSARTDTDLRDLPIRDIQRHLVEIGSLPERVLGDTDSFPVSDRAIREAVENGWDEYGGLALIFSDPGRAVPLLIEQLGKELPEEQALRYSLVLALLGREEGVPLLLRNLSASGWDEGWNYRGMHQFGMSLSEVDARLIALGRAAGPEAWPVIIDKIRSLGPDPDFSHCRAVAEACEGLYPRHPDAAAAPALADLLGQPGLAGHHQPDMRTVQAALTDDPNENAPRNRSLREIHLARALYRCGDAGGLGRSVLENYTRDLRGHFAKHCRAVLAEA